MGCGVGVGMGVAAAGEAAAGVGEGMGAALPERTTWKCQNRIRVCKNAVATLNKAF